MKTFQKMREQKGFTLIELAIVLVIIGIIIGAVLKGQDLIESARIKRFDNSMREWETAVWTYVDRKGTFPSDTDQNGIIGDTATAASAGDDIRGAGFINDPDENPVTVGSLNFYVQFGNDGNGTTPKNVMVICGSADCETALTTDQVKYVESFDTVIDGVSDGQTGSVVCVLPADITAGLISGSTTEAMVSLIGYTGTAVDAADCSTSTSAAVYFFDRGN